MKLFSSFSANKLACFALYFVRVIKANTLAYLSGQRKKYRYLNCFVFIYTLFFYAIPFHS